MLAGALTHHEGALRASLQTEYHLRLLPGGRVEPWRSLHELVDYVEHLPPGSALFRAMGGEAALTQEAMVLREVDYDLRSIAHALGGGKGKAPERLPLPKPAHEQRAEDAVMSAKARAWEARQRREAARSD